MFMLPPTWFGFVLLKVTAFGLFLNSTSMMHGEYGVEDVCLSTLTLVGPKGISGKIPMRMNKEETEKLQASAEALKSVIAQINL